MPDHQVHVPDDVLIAAAAGELARARCAEIERHLEQCAACAARRQALDTTMARVAAVLRDARAPLEFDRARVRLCEALRQELAAPPAPSRKRAVVITAALAVAATLVLGVWMGPRANRPQPAVDASARPVPALTPGATAATPAAVLCSAADPADPPIPSSIREQVLASYAMQNVPADQYELDYLITPELGGALDARNLWPQRYVVTGPWNALVKDELERLLPRLVCSGRLDLGTAQRDLAADWIAAYRKYFRTDEPLRTHVRTADPGAWRRPLGILPPTSRATIVFASDRER